MRGVFNGGASYAKGDAVTGPDGGLYASLVDGNTGNTPASNPSDWLAIPISASGTSANAAPKLFPTGTAATCRGDSIFYGYGTTTPATDSICAKLRGLTGWDLTDLAVSGDTDVDMMQRVNWNTPITTDSLTVNNIGTNTQVLLCAADGCGGTTLPDAATGELFKRLKEAWLLYDSTPDTQKIKANAMTQTGSWFALNTALAGYPSWALGTSTNGTKLAFSTYGTRVDVMLGIESTAGNGQPVNAGYAITVDGQTINDPVTGNAYFIGQTADSLGQNGGSWGMVDIPVENLQNTYHQVVITNTEPTGTAAVVYWGQGEAPANPSYSTPPLYYILPERAGRCITDAHVTDAVTSYFRNVALQAVGDVNATAGTRVVAIDITGGDGYDPNDPSQMNSDCRHPNTVGAARGAQAIYNVVQQVQAGVPGSVTVGGAAAQSSGGASGAATITSGTINGTNIGGTTPAPGAFTSVVAIGSDHYGIYNGVSNTESGSTWSMEALGTNWTSWPHSFGLFDGYSNRVPYVFSDAAENAASGVWRCWSQGVDAVDAATNPCDVGISRLRAGAITVDGATRGDGQGSITANEVYINGVSAGHRFLNCDGSVSCNPTILVDEVFITTNGQTATLPAFRLQTLFQSTGDYYRITVTCFAGSTGCGLHLPSGYGLGNSDGSFTASPGTIPIASGKSITLASYTDATAGNYIVVASN